MAAARDPGVPSAGAGSAWLPLTGWAAQLLQDRLLRVGCAHSAKFSTRGMGPRGHACAGSWSLAMELRICELHRHRTRARGARVPARVGALLGNGDRRPWLGARDRPVPGDRTVLRITPAGTRALDYWLGVPVQHVRDARSMLLLKLLFLARRGRDPRPLLEAQRARFESIVESLRAGVREAAGFDQTLLRWRLENVTAAVRFVDSIIDQQSRSTTQASGTASP